MAVICHFSGWFECDPDKTKVICPNKDFTEQTMTLKEAVNKGMLNNILLESFVDAMNDSLDGKLEYLDIREEEMRQYDEDEE